MHAPVLWGLKEEKKIEVYSYRKKVNHNEASPYIKNVLFPLATDSSPETIA